MILHVCLVNCTALLGRTYIYKDHYCFQNSWFVLRERTNTAKCDAEINMDDQLAAKVEVLAALVK